MEDEDWSPDKNRASGRAYMTRSRTQKIAPQRHLNCSCDEDSFTSRVPVKRLSKPEVEKNQHTQHVAKRSKLTVIDTNTQSKPATKKKKSTEISEYELQIQKNIEERKKMFEMLQLGDAKQDLLQVFANPIKRKVDQMDELEKKSSPPTKRGKPSKKVKKAKKTTVKKRVPMPPLRVSLRERKSTQFFDYLHEEESLAPQRSESASYISSSDEMCDSSSDVKFANTSLGMRLRGHRKRGISPSAQVIIEQPVIADAVVTLGNTYADQSSVDDSSRFVSDITPFLEKDESSVSSPNDLNEFVNLVKSFDVSADGMVTVLPKKITSLCWHPNTSRLLLAVGDVTGSIGFWDIDCESEFQRTRIYDVHSSHVTGLSFDKFNPLRLLSTSRDGYVRLLDFRTEVFNEIYSVQSTSRNCFPLHHIQTNPSTLLVSHADGRVTTIDIRVMATPVVQQFKCFETSIPTLSHHPTNENLILASCVNGEASIFDLRFVQPISSEESTVPVIRIPQNPSRLSGAFFSPCSGDYALVTGKNVLEVYDLREETVKCPASWDLTRSQRGTSLSYGTWHPVREDICIATGFDEDRKIEILSAPDGELLHRIEKKGSPHDHCCVNAFHPSYPIFASGSLTRGRVLLFRGPV